MDKKSIKEKKLKNKIFETILGVFVIIFILSFVFMPVFSVSRYGDKNFAERLLESSMGLTDTLGMASIRVYLLHGQLAYQSVKNMNELGDGFIAVYELTGWSAWIGIKETLNAYKNFFTKETNDFYKTQKSIEESIVSYSANVSGGLDAVFELTEKNFLLNKIQKFSSSLKTFFYSYLANVYGGFEYLTQRPFNSFVFGFNKSLIFVSNIKSNFVLNFKDNLKVVNEQFLYMTANVYSGVTDLFEINYKNN